MKRLLILTLTFILILTLFACGDKNQTDSDTKADTGSGVGNEADTPSQEGQAHVCNYTTVIEVVSPTCEDRGYKILSCSCGARKTENDANPLGHSYGPWEIDTNPTLSTEGKIIHTCINGHANALTLPVLSENDYYISAIDGGTLKVSCEAPTDVRYTYKKTVYDSATLSEREFSFEAPYTAPHSTLNTGYVFSSDNHYKKCSVCSGFDEKSAEAHSINDEKCTVCNYKPSDVTYSEEDFGLAVSYSANNSEITIPEYYAGQELSLVGKKINGIKIFKNNSNLRFITIPSSIKYIDAFAFEGCTALEKIYYDGTIEDWCNIEFGAKSNPMNYASKFYMKNKAGEYYEVKSITIPDTVSIIRGYTFEGFKSLESLTIPKSITVLGENLNDVFSEGSNIANVYYNGDILDWCKIKINARYSNPMQFTDNFFMRNDRDDYYKPTKLILPETITQIGDYQFISYTPLTSIIAESPLTKIGSYAFKDCAGILFVDISGGCAVIDAYAFSGCSMLMRLYLPKNLSSSGDFAFESCDALKEIYYLGNLNTWCTITFSTEKSTPMHVNKNRTYDISASFYYYSEENEEFYSSESEIITLTHSITEIGNYQFFGFSKIAQIILPEGIISIGNEAFAYCVNLNALVIPISVTHIGKSIIQGTNNSTEIYYGGSDENWSAIDINADNIDLIGAKKHYYAPTE